MEIEHINSKANAGLATGIIGTAGVGLGLLGALTNGGMYGAMPGRMYGYGDGYFNNHSVCRAEYAGEMNMAQEIARKDAEIQALKCDAKTDGKILDLYKYVENQLHIINAKFADQGIYNATVNGKMGSIAAQVHDLENVTKSVTRIVIPNYAVCPGWGNVTVTPEAAPEAGATA